MSIFDSFLERFTRLTASWRKPNWSNTLAELVASRSGVDQVLDYTLDQASKIAEAFKRPSGHQGTTENDDREEQPLADALPKGLVIYGHGCGSGGLTRAIAKVLNAHFITGTTCDPGGVASGPSISHYFSQAKELAQLAGDGRPVLLFLEGADNLTGTAPHLVPEARTTINAIAGHVENLAANIGVLVVIEAEALSQIDSALLAAGIFDIQIEVEKPDYKGRLAIFQRHLSSYHDLPGQSGSGKGSFQQHQGLQILVLLDGTWEAARSMELNEICQECAVLAEGLHADQIYRAIYSLRSLAAISGSVTAEQMYQAIETQQGKP